MPAEYAPAPTYILDLAREVVDTHHDDLQDARIGFLFRLEAPKSNGEFVLGKVRKCGPEEQAAQQMGGGRVFDFMVWIARDQYAPLSDLQKRALIDHLLCRLTVDVDSEKPKLVKPDIEEFNEIFERYGFWRPNYRATKEAIQARFDLEKEQGVGYIESAQPVTVADLFGEEGEDGAEDNDE